ncbi:glucitol operon activator protein [Streptococcus criceti]|uniref:Transcriptional regulator SrlR n=1 Tax=Streptococcus criceti HS-6 TaxID=873449 RepID=G5JNP1_STRCG|nr:transcriptional regulator GutM [Streptococcus criceti]EHI74843.1 transcriptional regulator SrlR [Streptococcus criceti HS-6]SUN41705.1 glucitol operon activator protein [Streptococcus criceti]
MNYIYTFAAFVVLAYLVQVILGLRQLKHFNQVYARLRQKGRVAIGRNSGRIKAGTIVMFAIDKQGTVLEAQKMQGVTIAAKFKPMPAYLGQDIHYFDHYNPLVRQENKLLQAAIEDARDIFLKTEAGVYRDAPQSSPFSDLGLRAKLFLARLKNHTQ